MKIRKLILKDFGIFNSLELDLNEKNTVIFGVNGKGKSTVLYAICLLYSNIINSLVDRKELRRYYGIDPLDIRNGASNTKIEIELAFSGSPNTIAYCRSSERNKKNKTYNKHELMQIAELIRQERGEGSEPKSVPVFVNYGINRQVSSVPLRIRMHHEFDIYSTYEKAIETKIDFRTFFEWFRNQEDVENQQKVESGDLSYRDPSLEAVRTAVLAMLPEFESIHVVRKPRLAMQVTKSGKKYNVSQLSDGEKVLMAMLGDLARRLAIANPESDKPLMGEGVVLIDEIELHMHPTWQRKILSILKNTFPNVQFIITTHSPQVLGEVDDTYNLYELQTGDDERVCAVKIDRLDGHDVNYILEEHMQTSSRNNKVKELVSKVNRLITIKEYAKAERLLEELEQISGGMDEEYLLARGFLKRSRQQNAKD